MLFISRCILRDQDLSLMDSQKDRNLAFGVVDTDDGVETVVNFPELEKIYKQNRTLKIEGIQTSGRLITDVEPYQVLSTKSALQTKLAVMFNIQTTMYKDVLTSICWDRHSATKSVKIRLSQLCSECADSIFWRPDICSRHIVTLIFDDKITFTKQSFAPFAIFTGGIGVEGFGVLYDLRELHNDILAGYVYNNVIESGAKLDSILDLPSRVSRMCKRFGV